MVANFEEKLAEYAHLLVEVGMNLQPGQTPRIAAPVECAPLARLCAAAALDRGARDVVLDWSDDFVTRQRYLKADGTVFFEFPDYRRRNSTGCWTTGPLPCLSSALTPRCSRGWIPPVSRPGADQRPAHQTLF